MTWVARSIANGHAQEVTVPLHPGSDLAQATLDAIADAVISIDASGIVTYLNPAAEAITGWSMATALGQPVDAVLHLFDPVTRRRVPNPLQQAIVDSVHATAEALAATLAQMQAVEEMRRTLRDIRDPPKGDAS